MYRILAIGCPALTSAPGRLLAAMLAGGVPSLLAYNLAPSPTLLNQCSAVALWGGFVLALRPGGLPLRGRLLFVAITAMCTAVLWSAIGGALPWALTLSALALLGSAAVLAWAGSDSVRRSSAPSTFGCFAAALATAGFLSAIVALLQVFAPDWIDGNFVAHSGLAGRAVGNLRQPNHLCSLLLWAVVSTIALAEMRWLNRRAALALVVLLVFAVELSASRTGALGLVLLAVWGLADRKLTRNSRVLLLSTPLLYALSYAIMSLYGDWSHQAIGAEARIAAGDANGIDSPNSRLRIWANALTLIAQQPWTGVGFGEFNLAWSLTPFPGRPTAFFDHTHTLPLQLAVELGVPLATTVLGLLAIALWQAWQRSARATGDLGAAARSAWMLVLLTGLHSLFEYPLWYAYFLLPTAYSWGFALGVSSPNVTEAPQRPESNRTGALVGCTLILGGSLAILDYMRVVEIYAPSTNAGPLETRIAIGQRSVLFAHHADYAAATSATPVPGTPLAFHRAPHYLMDTRLMIAWAQYLAAHGQLDLARALAARVREFRNPDSNDFFEPCTGGDTRSFQCQPQEAAHDWREFLNK